MCVTLRLFFFWAILEGVASQFISHPLGGFSYFTNTRFQPAVGYSYVAPTGQTVNVKFATSAFVQPAQPQISVTHRNSPQFVYQSSVTPAPLPLNAEIETDSQQQFASFQTPSTQPAVYGENLVSRRPAGPPRPESLFVPATGLEPLASDKQIQAYNDYLKELAADNTNTVSTTESQFDADFDLDPESYINIDFGEKI